jgi:hypothetical protein
MRVLYLVTRADLGGAQVHLLDLLRGFRSILEPTVAVGEEGYFTKAARELGVPVVILPNLVHPIAPMRDLRALVEVVRLIRAERPDASRRELRGSGGWPVCLPKDWRAGSAMPLSMCRTPTAIWRFVTASRMKKRC